MRTSRHGRQTRVCRSLLTILVCSLCVALPAAARDVAGVVVDQSGHVVPRARVRILKADGSESAAAFADELGRFSLVAGPGADDGNCRVEAALAGFQSASAPCGDGSGPVRIVLDVAPISETTIVTATRTDAPTSQIGASATVFTAEDLERRQKPFIADLLTSTPGAMVVRTGQPGGLTSLFVRGGESDYNMVLLDGVPLNEPGGTYYLSNLTTENMERVEIVRGAYSALFGTDAMGSVLQLFTKRAERGRPRGTVQFDGGTYDTLHGSASVSGGTGVLDYSAGAARFTTDNRTPNSRFENTTASGSLGIALPKSARIRAIGRTERGHAGTPGPTAYGRPDLDAASDRDDRVISAAFDQNTGSFRQQASYSAATSRQQSTNLILDPPYRATFRGRTAARLSTDFQNDSVTNLRRQHALYQADVHLNTSPRWGDHLLTALADWDGERSRVENRLAATTTINTRNNNGVAVQDQMLWARTFVTVGGRIERNDAFGTAAVPRATIVYVLHPASGAVGDTQIKASAGGGIKEPSMIESFSVSAFFRGNPDLKPERSRSVEVGLSQRFADDRAKAELTFFHNRFSDLISLVSDPVTFQGQYQNLGVARARGIEATIQASPARAVGIRAGYTFLDTEVLESTQPQDPVFGLGRALLRRPRHSGFAGVSYTHARIVADLNGVFIGSFADSDFGLFSPSFLESPGHQLWDARVSVRITPQIAALLSIDNLTNQDYSEPIGYQPLLRAVRAGVRVSF
jgi:vitamin B12 transporter